MFKIKALFCAFVALSLLTSFVSALKIPFTSIGFFEEESINQAPIFTATPTIPSTIVQGQSHVFKVQVYDPDGDPITIEWYLDSELVSNTNEYNFIAVSSGVYIVTVIISDGQLTIDNSVNLYKN